MSNEFQVVFHNIDQSAALTENVNKRIQKLQRYSNDIIGGRVVLDSPHNNHHKGKVFSVTLEIHISGKEVIVKQGQHDKPAHEDIYVAVRDAFNAAERQLKANGKKPRKSTLAVENFEVLPEVAADDADEMMMTDDDDTDFTLYSPDEPDDRASYATQAA
ncbi:MAG: HPF/RaiA family ribosome-associated protein [Gammaproteobacteria bacterium]|nr:HPF/RaiA family ribosome-associated protein [Gammaproteobacteria bacterium]MDP2141951.1 HPF/RaiA family ribosome-associated protein [Gammaproteobacteria bacterium]MDP2347167.1 HPF/RaiA family ribosome-associated protein [Gammaproteobacteria bacterium]